MDGSTDRPTDISKFQAMYGVILMPPFEEEGGIKMTPHIA